MLECVSAQFWCITGKNTNKVTSYSPLTNDHSQTGSNIFVTSFLKGSGATTCKYEMTLI